MCKNTQEPVLILAPHTDDGEIGCGGSIAKLLEKGREVYYAAFSVCEASVPPPFPKDILEIEVKKATLELGIPASHLHLFRYPVRRFVEYRQSILEDMLQLRNTLHPGLVFMPIPSDVHQDHQVIAAEAVRAFKHASLLGYEMVWNNFSIHTSCFFTLAQRHIDKKVAALAKYTSQQGIREYMKREFVESLAKVRGVQIGATYAEAFEVLRWIDS